MKNIQKLILDGAYTRKTLQDAIIEVLENACTPVEKESADAEENKQVAYGKRYEF